MFKKRGEEELVLAPNRLAVQVDETYKKGKCIPFSNVMHFFSDLSSLNIYRYCERFNTDKKCLIMFIPNGRLSSAYAQSSVRYFC